MDHNQFGNGDAYYQAFKALRAEHIPRQHLALLRAHYDAPDHVATWSQLAKAVGYANRNAVNLQYGKLAGRVAHALGVLEPPEGFWLYVLAGWAAEREVDTGHTAFVLRRPVIEALRRLGVFPDGPLLNDQPRKHFLQYHSPERMGPYESDGSRFGIQTNKAVDKLLEHRVWLITSEPGRPRRYYVCETFIVDKTRRHPRGPRHNLALGSVGQVFRPMVRIDDAGWFGDLRRSKANFSLGLTELVPEMADHLMRVTAMAVPAAQTSENLDGLSGARFGSAENNREVEQEAIRAVRDVYLASGWTVVSVEHERLGYDLRCSHGVQVEHVEVKGVRGGNCSFVITANELAAARADPKFKLCAVLRALDGATREIRTFLGSELCAAFSFEPLSFFAKPASRT